MDWSIRNCTDQVTLLIKEDDMNWEVIWMIVRVVYLLLGGE